MRAIRVCRPDQEPAAKELDISGNPAMCGGQELGGFRKLCKIGLAESPELTSLDLSHCGITAAHRQKFLAPALESRLASGGRNLKVLNLVGNPMCGSQEAISQVSMSVKNVLHMLEKKIKTNTNIQVTSRLMDWHQPATQGTSSAQP